MRERSNASSGFAFPKFRWYGMATLIVLRLASKRLTGT